MNKICTTSKDLVERIELLLKNRPIFIAISFFLISLSSLYFAPREPAIVFVVGAFGSIFVALKYRLDQANYHRELFDSRYECFLMVEKILDEWLKVLTANEAMIENLNSVMRKSYFLFGGQTYQFISNFRTVISRENSRRLKGDSTAITDDSRFLEKLLFEENLPNEFGELKIYGY